ncbi:MAG: alcohol dehydrogenase catalytic domain-containing protein [Deltaproteobacteria bacterium]|nr:alcohol dehydrogenase catalytic domain-containing protein [Deltaproteobacteria bacterium]
MRALVLDGTPSLRSDWPTSARAPGEAWVRVRLAGVCDTDLQLAQGYMNYRGVLGHEFVGEVIACDSPEWLGRRVVGDINAGCGQCAECLSRGGHHCPTRTVLGIVGRDGALAESLVLPERCLVAVPDSVTDEEAVFAEPLAAALHVVDAISGHTPQSALVVGDGKLGLLCALALRASGIATLVVGRHAHKLAIAAAAHCETALERDIQDPLALRADLVVEATGNPQGLALALSLTAPRGVLVLKTTVHTPAAIDLNRLVIDEITLTGSRCGDLAQAIASMARKAIDPRPLIAARYPLSDALEALAHAGRKGTLKVLVAPE